ncbi:unnamed protein product [Sphenostylis stenocarpa]|uniref:Uncharacterized protein n=1 Tax=Sphenostylis stenocarpa TaxID=92480 RepID=A0AA86RP19_9FABA|nr:unnamed protein product [Sphenostylis stenocarpa]
MAGGVCHKVTACPSFASSLDPIIFIWTFEDAFMSLIEEGIKGALNQAQRNAKGNTRMVRE